MNNALPTQSAGQVKPCLNCGLEFRATRAWQRFCGDRCRFIWHKREKELCTVRLPEHIFQAVQAIAEANGCPTSEMAARMLDKLLNPDKKPIDDLDIYGATP